MLFSILTMDVLNGKRSRNLDPAYLYHLSCSLRTLRLFQLKQSRRCHEPNVLYMRSPHVGFGLWMKSQQGLCESMNVCKRIVKERQCTPHQTMVDTISICIIPQQSLYYVHIYNTSSRHNFPDSLPAFSLMLHPHTRFHSQRAESGIERHARLYNKPFPPLPNLLHYILPSLHISNNNPRHY